VNEAAWERVEEFKVGERVDADHLPLEGTTHEEKGKGGAAMWDEQGVKEYRRRLEKATFEEQEVEKMAAELKEVVEKATNEVVKGVERMEEEQDRQKQIPGREKKIQREM
jgi:hypothetical protein